MRVAIRLLALIVGLTLFLPDVLVVVLVMLVGAGIGKLMVALLDTSGE